MKKYNIQDERVVAQRRKINSESFVIIMIALICSVVVQDFLLNAPFEQYAAEVICFAGMGIYMIVRYITAGLNINGEGKHANKIPIVISIVVGIIVTAINGISNYATYSVYYKDNVGFLIAALAITFIGATVLTLVLFMIVNYFNKKKQEKIQRLLDEDEQD